VTGATDGIGLAAAKELAGRGFNIVLVSRNKAKLEEKAEEVAAVRCLVYVKVVQCDFSTHFTAEDTRKIWEENDLESLDISILVNNVGQVNFGSFHEIEE